MRLIDADALRKCFEVPHELKCGIQAGMDEYALKCIDEQPTITASPWHRMDDEPPQSGQECFTAYRYILRSDPEWLYDICYYTDDLARDCPLMDGAEHRPGWYRYESEYGDVECHPKYWMLIPEPPKEDA